MFQLSSVESSLWSQYANNRSLENRNKIFQFYSEWVRKVASRQYSLLRPEGVEWADFVQSASIALMESIERFDYSCSVPFESFAFPRVRGAILNTLPALPAISIDAIHEQYLESGRSAHYSEVEINVFDQFLDAVLEIAFSEILVSSSYKAVRIDGDPLKAYICNSEAEKVVAAVGQLPDDLQFIITAHYINFMRFSQIATQLSLSRSRVSQLHKEALRRLRFLYEDT